MVGCVVFVGCVLCDCYRSLVVCRCVFVCCWIIVVRCLLCVVSCVLSVAVCDIRVDGRCLVLFEGFSRYRCSMLSLYLLLFIVRGCVMFACCCSLVM